MSMFPWIDYVTDKIDQRARSIGKRKEYMLNRELSIRWILRGILFIPILLVVEHFYRPLRFTGSTAEDVLMAMFLISVAALLQLPIGLYYYLRNRMQDIEKGRDE